MADNSHGNLEGGDVRDCCGTCSFWRSGDEVMGECRRFPPRIIPSLLDRDCDGEPLSENYLGSRGTGREKPIEFATRFPITFVQDDCGEHRRRG